MKNKLTDEITGQDTDNTRGRDGRITEDLGPDATQTASSKGYHNGDRDPARRQHITTRKSGKHSLEYVRIQLTLRGHRDLHQAQEARPKARDPHI